MEDEGLAPGRRFPPRCPARAAGAPAAGQSGAGRASGSDPSSPSRGRWRPVAAAGTPFGDILGSGGGTELEGELPIAALGGRAALQRG